MTGVQTCALPISWLRQQAGFEVEWVGRLSVTVLCDAVQRSGQLLQLGLSLDWAMVAPCGNDQWGVAAGISNDAIILWSDGIRRGQQLARICTAESEGVDHSQSVETPAAGKIHTASNGGIIEHGISGRWVQSDEDDLWAAVPLACQAITPTAAG